MIKLLAGGVKCAFNITFSSLPVSRESAKVNTGILMRIMLLRRWNRWNEIICLHTGYSSETGELHRVVFFLPLLDIFFFTCKIWFSSGCADSELFQVLRWAFTPEQSSNREILIKAKFFESGRWLWNAWILPWSASDIAAYRPFAPSPWWKDGGDAWKFMHH